MNCQSLEINVGPNGRPRSHPGLLRGILMKFEPLPPAQRDEPGPDHSPDASVPSRIEGVVIQSSPTVSYKDGILAEHYRPEWGGVFKVGEPIEHMYSIHSPTGGTRDEWYFHEKTLDRYVLMVGQLRLGLYDGRLGSPTQSAFEVVLLGAPGSGLANAVRIPPGVWHSLSWISDEGVLCNFKTPPYNRGLVDKFRIGRDNLPPEINWT